MTRNKKENVHKINDYIPYMEYSNEERAEIALGITAACRGCARIIPQSRLNLDSIMQRCCPLCVTHLYNSWTNIIDD